MIKIISLFLALSTFGFSQNATFESAYIDIDINKNCKTLKTYESSMGSSFDCGKFANISIEISSDDGRDFIDLIRDKKRYSLDLTHTITPLFRKLGKKMEWRYPKGQATNPTAMIVRLNIQIEGEKKEEMKTDSYLIISKITNESICIVDKVASQSNQNKLARDIADKASTLPCMADREMNKRIY